MISIQKNMNVQTPSLTEIHPSERQMYIQMYAHIEAILVTLNTNMSLTFLGSSPTAMIDTPLITSRLKAADPTIVAGPISGGTSSIAFTVEITERRISGAEDPNAMSVKFATVAFHICLSTTICFSPSKTSKFTV